MTSPDHPHQADLTGGTDMIFEIEDENRNGSLLRAAVCSVMLALRRLEKADRNKFASYDFTSVDDFKDELRPLMAANGLTVHVDQTSFSFHEMRSEKDKPVFAAQYDFAMTLEHTSGETSRPERMTVVLAFTGAQTSGAARSYAIKEWMKSKYLASAGKLGDQQEEADLRDQGREGLRMAKSDARAMYTELESGLRKASSGMDHLALAKWWDSERERLNSLPKDWFLGLKNEYAKAYIDLKAQADLDRASNDQLDEIAMRHDAAEPTESLPNVVKNMLAG